SGVHELLGDDVVALGGVPGFPPPDALQPACGRFCPLLLQCGPQVAVPLAVAVDLAAGHDLAIRGGGDVDDAEVHTEEPGGLVRCGFGHVDSGGQEVHAVPHHQV